MSSATNTAVEYRQYRASDAQQVIEVLADVFPRRDPLAVAANLTSAHFADFVRSLLPQAAQDGLTIVACLPSTGDIVGVLLANDAASLETLSEVDERFGPVASILGELDGIYLRDRKPRPGEMLHLYLLGVSDRAAGQGAGQQLVTDALENGARKGYRIAFAEATNKTSQHIFRKLGFAERGGLLYRDHRFNGQSVFADIAEHGGPILMEKELVLSGENGIPPPHDPQQDSCACPDGACKPRQ